MKITMNLSVYLIVGLFAGNLLAAGEGKNVEAVEKALSVIKNITNEMYTTENTYSNGLENLINLEKRLIGQKRSGIKWFFTSAKKKQEIDGQVKEEIENLYKISAASKVVKNLFLSLKDSTAKLATNISFSERGILDFNDDEKKEYQTYLGKLNDIAKIVTEGNAPEASINYIEKYQENKDVMVNSKGKLDPDIDNLRSTIFQRVPRYVLLFKVLIEKLAFLVGTDNEEILKTAEDDPAKLQKFKDGILTGGEFKDATREVLEKALAVNEQFKALATKINESIRAAENKPKK